MSGQVACCPTCGEPVAVFTFDHPGAAYRCVPCDRGLGYVSLLGKTPTAFERGER